VKNGFPVSLPSPIAYFNPKMGDVKGGFTLFFVPENRRLLFGEFIFTG